MNVISAFLRKLLRANDPAIIDRNREAAFATRLFDRLALEPTTRPAAPRRPAFHLRAWSQSFFPTPSFAAMGFAVLLLGLFVGHEIGATIRPVGLTTALVDSKSSVLAMSNPWQDFIVDGTE